MMKLCEQLAIENGFEEMNLTVHPENQPAVGFYERLGYLRVPDGDLWKGRMVKPLYP